MSKKVISRTRYAYPNGQGYVEVIHYKDGSLGWSIDSGQIRSIGPLTSEIIKQDILRHVDRTDGSTFQS